MLIRPGSEDFRLIAFVMGRILLVTAAAGLIPAAWAVAAGEWRPLSSFILMVGLLGVLGAMGRRLRPPTPRFEWRHGMVIVALTWLVVPVIAAVPLLQSGHFADPVDALFDSVSGLTTTGLSVMSDLDHLASSLNLWRHLLQFLGGLGIVVVALTLFAEQGGVALYFGEGRGERFLPSATSMARFFWRVAAMHLVVVAGSLVLVGWLLLGFEPHRALLHGVTMFLAGFSTGGFAPQSTSIGYYHSPTFEVVAAIAMVGGAMSFGLHYSLWKGQRRSALANLETRTILASFGFTLLLTLVGLAATGVFAEVSGLTRQGLFQVLSAQTTTGWSTVPAAELSQWGGLAFVGIAIAMAVGGMGSATAGGVKALRVGLAMRALVNEIRQALLPEGAVVSTRYYQGGARHLTPEVAQSVMTISLLFVALYLLGAAVGFAYGIPLHLALFESVSASATIGLSTGITDPSMPLVLELVYMLQMWAGRLEFVALFSLLGFLYAWARGQ
jgi:trk system potassium uptake protein TrkH